MQHMKKILILLNVIFILFACNNQKSESEYSDYFYKIVNSENWHLRGIEIGDRIDSVKTAETSRLVKETKELLYYESKLNDSDYINISYYFDKSLLYEIRFDINITNRANANLLYQNLNVFLNKQLGQKNRIESYDIWKTKNDFSQKIEIAISKDTSETSSTKLFLSVVDYDYK